MSGLLLAGPEPSHWSAPAFLGNDAHALWEHARNCLGIARLLVQEGRPDAFAATASRAALEYACRAALSQAGTDYDGDLERAFRWLSLPEDLRSGAESSQGPGRIQAVERTLAWLASYLRSEAPDRAWGF